MYSGVAPHPRGAGSNFFRRAFRNRPSRGPLGRLGYATAEAAVPRSVLPFKSRRTSLGMRFILFLSSRSNAWQDWKRKRKGQREDHVRNMPRLQRQG
jgi:hypothetical protein